MTFQARGLYASSSKEPRRRRFRWLWVGAVVALLALLGGAAGALGAVPVGTEGDSRSFDGAEGLVVENRTGGPVTVTEGGGESLRIESELRNTLLNKAESELDQDGDGVVRAVAECEGAFGAACSVEYEITVPAGTEVTVETVSGEVELAGLTGPVQVDTTSGEIEASDLSGSADLRSTSGEIDVSGATGDALRAATTSGEVDLEGVDTAELEAESVSGGIGVEGGFDAARLSTTSGSVEVEAERPFERLTAETVSGGVELRVPEGRTYDVRTDTTSGSAEVGVDTAEDAESLIDASTTSGSVEITGG
ncbi:DUF4097 family beta strand repeat-containing protein [Nocardiopsis potens]|uniref:DUF4097 family beta strand repeat-containing protein n=1 Tax=Nocardiopsis potens TaxID=1246458 RepID=UPI00034DB86B|nr:DUF4097 family beta strand repeat-containing protein [Nocardiopsis potens]